MTGQCLTGASDEGPILLSLEDPRREEAEDRPEMAERGFPPHGARVPGSDGLVARSATFGAAYRCGLHPDESEDGAKFR